MAYKEMPYIVGQTIQKRRQVLGWSQKKFGTKLAPYLGEPWSTSLVSQAENGRRKFQLTELVAIAHVLNMRLYVLLLVDPKDYEGVAFIDPQDREHVLATLSVDQLQPLGDLRDPDSAAEQIAQVRMFVSDMARNSEALARLVGASVASLSEAHMAAVGAADDLAKIAGALTPQTGRL